MTSMSNVEFNGNTGKAQRMAEREPVFIIDNGTASHVLISIGDYRKLTGHGKAVSDRRSMDDDIAFDPQKANDIDFRPVEFD